MTMINILVISILSQCRTLLCKLL